VPTARWSPDGTHLAFLARPEGVQDVYVIGANGRRLRRLTHGEGDHFGDVSWSPDGRRIAFTCCGMGTESIYLINSDIAFFSVRDANPELYSIEPDGTGLKRLTLNRAEDDDPAWSPDGQQRTYLEAFFGSCLRDGSPALLDAAKPPFPEVRIARR
jgi:TolB protein